MINMVDESTEYSHNAYFGNLYIVSTPIGNLQDITIRAIKTLHSVDIIACEDTRRTGLLLAHIFPIFSKLVDQGGKSIARPRLISFNDFNEEIRTDELLMHLKHGKTIALVSDSGTPLISDPGYKLVRACIKTGISIESIPGPSSAVAALSVSGLPTDQFLFLGYLPKKSAKRKEILSQIEAISEQSGKIHPTVILFEAPHRILETLSDIKNTLGNIEIVIARELTKVFQELSRNSVQKFIDKYEKIRPKGEFVILFSKKAKN